MDNNKTVTIKMETPIATPEGSYNLQYWLSIRDGASGPMMAETVAHFLHAVEMLAQGKPGDECGEEFTERSEYELSDHGKNRIVIYGDIQVFTNSGLRLVPVNIFSETTSAQDFVNFVWGVMEGLGRITQLPKTIKINGAVKPPPKAKSELDKHFGERKPQAQRQPPPQTDHQSTDPSDTPRLGAYNYKQKAEYTAKYGGQTVRFDVLKMSRIYDSRDGSPLVQVYSSYNGSLSQYPAHDLKIKPNRLEKVDGFTLPLLQAILDGAENNAAYEGSYYMFVNDEGKLYPVLVKLSPKGQEHAPDPAGAYDDSAVRSDTDYDSIPF